MNNNQPSTLRTLRARLPRRGLSAEEAMTLAERQAQLFLRLSSTTDVPVPMQTLLDLPHIELAVDRTLKSSGASFWTGTAWRLVAHGDEHPNRQRFSLMHEFKHVIDHPYRDLLYATEAERERIADHFAACVLMPKTALTRAWCSGLQDVHDLARHFAASPQAMQRRLTELGLGEPRFTRTYTCSRGLRDGARFAIAGTAAGPGGRS